MRFDFDGSAAVPLFVQLSEQVKDGILEGVFREGEQIPSSTEISLTYKINPATVNKGVNLLVDEGIVFKRRGLGMFVADGAKKAVAKMRSKSFAGQYIDPMLKAAERLGISIEEIVGIINNSVGKDDK